MTVRRISIEQAQELLISQAQVIDIRDPEAFAEGHISGAFNLQGGNVDEFVDAADQQLPLLVYCYHGIMSQSAAAYFSQQGFEDACSLDGGFEAWRDSGLEVEIE